MSLILDNFRNSINGTYCTHRLMAYIMIKITTVQAQVKYEIIVY